MDEIEESRQDEEDEEAQEEQEVDIEDMGNTPMGYDKEEDEEEDEFQNQENQPKRSNERKQSERKPKMQQSSSSEDEEDDEEAFQRQQREGRKQLDEQLKVQSPKKKAQQETDYGATQQPSNNTNRSNRGNVQNATPGANDLSYDVGNPAETSADINAPPLNYQINHQYTERQNMAPPTQRDLNKSQILSSNGDSDGKEQELIDVKRQDTNPKKKPS